MEQVVESLAVVKPQTVEIARRVECGLEEVLDRAADYFEAVVQYVVARYAVALSAAQVEHLAPKLLPKVLRGVAAYYISNKQPRIFRSCPFQRRVEAGVEHKSVAHIVAKHIGVQHRRLTDYRLGLYVAFQYLEFAAHFSKRINVVRADKQRVAYTSPHMLFVTVAVQSHCGNMNKLRLRVCPFDSVYKHAYALFVAFDRKLGVLVGMRGNDRRHIDYVAYAVDETFASRLVGNVSVNNLYALDILFVVAL